jgi:hypothetical protein
MKIHEEATHKETNAIQAKKVAGAGLAFFKFQSPGEQVLLSGSQSAPHLNGIAGELMSRYADENGFLRVRMPKWARTNATMCLKTEVDMKQFNPYREIKVRPHRLKPVRHPSDTRPRGGVMRTFCRPQVEDGVSVKSCTATASVVSSRLSTPALSVSASLPALATQRSDRSRWSEVDFMKQLVAD